MRTFMTLSLALLVGLATAGSAWAFSCPTLVKGANEAIAAAEPKAGMGDDRQKARNAGMIEEAGRVPEMAAYQTWLQRTGGDAPSYAGAQAWAAGVMFTLLASRLGGKQTRASVVKAAAGLHRFTGNGIIPPTDPGARRTSGCFTIMKISDGRFNRVTPFPYTCGPLG